MAAVAHLCLLLPVLGPHSRRNADQLCPAPGTTSKPHMLELLLLRARNCNGDLFLGALLELKRACLPPCHL